MIRKKTVLVVGAGGSIPYGLPSGGELLNMIVTTLKNQDLYSAIYRLTGKDQTETERVRNRLIVSMTDSVDAFLEKNPNDTFVQDLGKIAIAFCLWPKLKGVKTFSIDSDEDWIRFVWNKMLQETRSLEELRSNAVTFITFNFDTLIESKLFDAIVALYPDVNQQQVLDYVNSIVIHVHGTLPQPSNQQTPSFEWLQEAKEGIRVVHQELADSLLNSLSNVINGAEIVAFLGFGYHPDNLKKLGFPRNRDLMFGSAYKLGNGEKAQVKQAVGAAYDKLVLGEADQDCKAFLKEHNVLRS